MWNLPVPHTIIAADWGHLPRKRRAVSVDMESLTVRGVAPFDGANLSSLARLSPGAGTLIAVDAVVGIPRYVAEAYGADGFFDWLRRASADKEFFQEATQPEHWKPTRPFWRNPDGEGSQRRFLESLTRAYPAFPPDHGLRRAVDPPGAKPPTCVSNLPGSVGSGTRELWRELLEPGLRERLAVWPFDGRRITELVRGPRPVFVEAYPALAYGIVLGERLPARLNSLPKTQESARERALDRLVSSVEWVRPFTIEGGLLQAALSSEDSFDALFLVLALCRLALEDRLDPEDDEVSGVEPKFEGGIVGTWCVTREPREPPEAGRARRQPERRGDGLQCPIAGCSHVFARGRGGWDGHVGSRRIHPGWQPEESNPDRRRDLFRAEYSAWFES